MKLLVIGANGQLGRELIRTLACLGSVEGVDRTRIDLTDPDSIAKNIREIKAAVVVNAAAYTAVDRAESEPEIADAVNGVAPGILAEECRKSGAIFLHYSTDYVFDGFKPTPYTELDAPAPLNAYGRSKLLGEQNVTGVGGRSITLRTSWVYSCHGNNFLLSMLRLAGERSELRVVNDQTGSPTWSRMIAEASSLLVAKLSSGAGNFVSHADFPAGVFNLSASGETTWYGFARAILKESKFETAVTPITSEQYNAVAVRPKNSLLDNRKFRETFGLTMPDWQVSFQAAIADLKGNIATRAATARLG